MANSEFERLPIWERIARSIRIDDATGCHLWTRDHTKAGYGRICYMGERQYAHRLVWKLTHGWSLPDDLHVCHTCDNPKCVNPKHLFLGTDADNQRDKVRKGRQLRGEKLSNIMKEHARRGETHPCAKLTENDVRAIRKDDLDNGALAAKYGVSQATISRIRTGITWRMVK